MMGGCLRDMMIARVKEQDRARVGRKKAERNTVRKIEETDRSTTLSPASVN